MSQTIDVPYHCETVDYRMILAPTYSLASRVTIRRTLPATLLRARQLTPTELTATIKLENGLFCPGSGLQVSSSGPLRIEFPEPGTINIVTTGSRYRSIHGIYLITVPRYVIEIANLEVQSSGQITVLIGTLSQVWQAGTLSMNTQVDPTGVVLDPKGDHRSFALRV